MEKIILNFDYEEEQVASIALSRNMTVDIEVEDIHNYILANGIVSHNSSVTANNVSSGIEPIFAPEYIRTFIIPYPPEGLYVPKQIDWKKYEVLDNIIP